MLCSKAKNSFSVIIAGYVNIDIFRLVTGKDCKVTL